MTEQDIDLRDPRELHRAAEHHAVRGPGFAAELETRVQELWADLLGLTTYRRAGHSSVHARPEPMAAGSGDG